MAFNELLLALALLVTRVAADYVDPPFAADNLAILADAFDARSHLHRPTPGVSGETT